MEIMVGMDRERKAFVRFTLAAAILLFVTSASASTLYVDARRGMDTNAATRDAPLKTIQRAADSSSPGDTVLVAAGSYTERIHVTRSGASGHSITYQASGKAETGGFTVTADYVRVEGFEISSPSRLYEDNVGVYVRGQHNEILNNYIHDIYNDGIVLAGRERSSSRPTAYNVVKGNRIYRAGSSGITVDGKENLIEGNDISHIIQYHPGGPVFDGADADGLRPFGTGHIFRNNRVHDIRSDELGNLAPHIDCIETWGPATNMLFEQNVCDMEDTDYVPVQAAQIENGSGMVNNITFRNNVFMNVRVGIHVEKLASSDITSVQIANNTFYRITHQAILFEGRSSGAVENNAFYDVGSHEDSYVTMNPDSKEVVVGYNAQSMSDGRAPGTRGSHVPYPRDIWGVDLGFVNAAGKDFHLLPKSPLRDAGVPLKDVTTDFEGVPRPQGSAYDIGAYEHKP
jgi:hypothetical protein